MKSNPPELQIDMFDENRGLDSGHPEDVFSKDGKEDTTISVIHDVASRRETKKAHKPDDTFSKVFHSSPNPICIVSIEGETFVDINESYSRFTGYTREETIGRTSKELGLWINEDDLKTMRSILIQKGRMYNHQFASRMKSGEIRIGLFSAEIVNIAGKKCMVLVVTDVTEQKWAEDALKESEAFTSSLLTNTPNPICVAYPDSSIKYVNPAFEKLTGFALNEIIGMKTPYPWWPQESKEEIDKTLKRGVLGNSAKREMSYRKKNGEPFWVELTPTMIKKNGKQQYILVNWVDITERKRMETALRESEEKFSKAFNTSPTVMSVTTLDGTFVEVNESFLRMTGLTREQVIGRSSHELNIWGNANDRNSLAEKVREHGRINNEEYQFRGKSGELHTALFSVEKINIGDKPCLITVSNDITKRKQMEEALRFSDAAFKSIHESVIAVDNAMIISYWNDTSEQLFGVKAAEALGKKLTNIIKPFESHDGHYKELYQKIMDLGYNREELLYSTPRGEVWVDMTMQVIREGDKQYGYVLTAQDITGRKQAEKALHDSEDKFSRAFSSASDAMAIFSSKGGKFLEVNDSYVKLSGYSREELVGHNADELNMWGKPEDREKILQITIEKGQVVQEEFAFRTKWGGIRTCLFSAESINVSGERRMIVVVQDITERKQMEMALRESEEKFSKAFNASANAICITSLEDRCFIEANESFTRFTGYAHDEVIGHSATDFNLWVNNAELQRGMEELEKYGRFYNHEFRSRMKSGEIRTGLSSVEMINIGGKPCRMVVITDITERKKTEEGLRLLGSVTQQVTDSIVVTDPDFKITYMNKAAQDLFGYSIDEVLGTDIGLYDAVPIGERVREDIRNAINTGKTWAAVLTKRRKDGSTFLCDCRRSPLFNEDGRLASHIIVYRDITEQKETEAKLKAHKQLVESILTSMPEGVLVTDSSDRIMLANESFRRIFHTGRRIIDNKLLYEVLRVEQLFDFYSSIKTGNTDIDSLEFRYKVKETEKIIACSIIKMDSERMLLIFSDISRIREEEDKLYLRDRLASLGEMAAGLAHEINNPLTGILTLSQLLVNSDLPDEQKEDMQCVYSEAKRAATIVKNVLLFTRNNSYENGKSSVNEVVKEVLRLREHEEKVNNINAVTNFQDNLPQIQLDKYQLQQVCLNIILNAEAAIEEAKRPGTLTITTEKVGNHVNIIFSDNGCGIRKQVLPRIFDPFFTTKEVGKGTGLGLSICYGIIVKHNGKISVKTQVGEGTTFTIRMPIAY